MATSGKTIPPMVINGACLLQGFPAPQRNLKNISYSSSLPWEFRSKVSTKSDKGLEHSVAGISSVLTAVEGRSRETLYR
jgi:hypothetical protein